MRLSNMAKMSSTIDPSIVRSIKFSVILQGILFIFGGTFDFGTLLGSLLSAVFVYWIGLFIVVARRNNGFTLSDRIFIRWGSLFLWILTLLFMWLIWHLKNY